MGKIDEKLVTELVVRAMRTNSVSECRSINRELKKMDLENRKGEIVSRVLDRYR